MKLLSIESSCDETAAAVVEDGRRVLSSVIDSQVREHQVYGGVVPEIASRRHTENIVQVTRLALAEAGAAGVVCAVLAGGRRETGKKEAAAEDFGKN